MNVLKYEKICKNMHKPSDAWQTIHFKRIMGSYGSYFQYKAIILLLIVIINLVIRFDNCSTNILDDFMKAKMKLKVAEEKSDLES